MLNLIQRPIKLVGPLILHRSICKGSLDPKLPVVRQAGNPLKVHHSSYSDYTPKYIFH